VCARSLQADSTEVVKALVAIAQAPVVAEGEPNALLLNSVHALAKRMLLNNKLGPIVFLAPELGKWSTVGGAFDTRVRSRRSCHSCCCCLFVCLFAGSHAARAHPLLRAARMYALPCARLTLLWFNGVRTGEGGGGHARDWLRWGPRAVCHSPPPAFPALPHP
jgi:hypothetical protein